MTVVRTFHKAPIERRRLYLNYTCWLEDTEQLTDLQVTIAPLTADAPLQVTMAYTDSTHKKLTMFASGGVANTNYTLQVVVNTNEGQRKRDDLGIRVTS